MRRSTTDAAIARLYIAGAARQFAPATHDRTSALGIADGTMDIRVTVGDIAKSSLARESNDRNV